MATRAERPGATRKEGGDWPCGHRAPSWDIVDADFDVICQTCFGHFFRHAYVPYFVLVGLFTLVYFLRPVPLASLLFILFGAFVLGYISVVLRKRPARLLLTIGIAVPVGVLVLRNASEPILGSAALDPVSSWSLVALIGILLMSFLHSVAKISESTPENRASGAVVLLVVTSVALTLLNLALHVARMLFPSLDRTAPFVALFAGVEAIQRYRLLMIFLAVAVALTWAAAKSIGAAQEDERQSNRDSQGLFDEATRMFAFFAKVLVTTVIEVWRVFRDTVRRLWRMASSSLRVVLLAAASLLLARALVALASNTAAIWVSPSPWPGRSVILALCLSVALIWILSWVILVTAFIFDRSIHRDMTWGLAVAHAFMVLRFSLLRSTLVYWFYLSLVLFVSWFLIQALRYGVDRALPQLGAVSIAYAASATLAISIRSFWKAHGSDA